MPSTRSQSLLQLPGTIRRWNGVQSIPHSMPEDSSAQAVFRRLLLSLAMSLRCMGISEGMSSPDTSQKLTRSLSALSPAVKNSPIVTSCLSWGLLRCSSAGTTACTALGVARGCSVAAALRGGRRSRRSKRRRCAAGGAAAALAAGSCRCCRRHHRRRRRRPRTRHA